MEWLERTELLIGKENLTKLNEAHVLVAGMGEWAPGVPKCWLEPVWAN